MENSINVTRESSILIVDDKEFVIKHDMLNSYVLQRNGREEVIRKDPLFFLHDRLTNKEINFLELDRSAKKFLKAGCRKAYSRVDS